MQAVSQTDCAEKYQYENSERVCIRAFGSKWRRKIDIDENIVRDDAGRCREEANDSVECENLPKWICVNEKLLIRSWENLVYNAIEYTPQGGMIRICISEGNEQLEISVEDEGSGFSAEDLQSAKKLFYQGDKSRHSRKHYGWACIWQSNLQKKTEEVLHWPTLRG